MEQRLINLESLLEKVKLRSDFPTRGENIAAQLANHVALNGDHLPRLNTIIHSFNQLHSSAQTNTLRDQLRKLTDEFIKLRRDTQQLENEVQNNLAPERVEVMERLPGRCRAHITASMTWK